MVAVLARYAARFSVRALDLTVDSSLLWVGVGLALAAAVLLAFVPRLPSADAANGMGLVERQRADHDRHEPPAARVRGHADRRVVRAARRRRACCSTTLFALQRPADRLQHGNVLAVNVPVVSYDAQAARRSRGFYKEAMRRDRGAAWRRARGGRHGRAVARPGLLRRASSSRSRATRKANGEEDPRAQVPHRLAGLLQRARRADHRRPRLQRRPIARDGEKVVIVSQSLAQRMFPSQDAVNRRLMWTDPVMKFIGVSTGPRRIVGVAADIDDENVVPGPAMTRLSPDRAGDRRRPAVRAREDGSVRAGAADHADHPRRCRPISRSSRPATLDDVRAEVLAPDRLNALVFGGFAGVALLIAVVGVAGVLAFSVSARTREFGVRLAIGSTPTAPADARPARGRGDRRRRASSPASIGGLAAGAARRQLRHRRAACPGSLPIVGAACVLVAAAVARVADAGGARVARGRHPGAAIRVSPGHHQRRVSHHHGDRDGARGGARGLQLAGHFSWVNATSGRGTGRRYRRRRKPSPEQGA